MVQDAMVSRRAKARALRGQAEKGVASSNRTGRTVAVANHTCSPLRWSLVPGENSDESRL